MKLTKQEKETLALVIYCSLIGIIIGLTISYISGINNDECTQIVIEDYNVEIPEKVYLYTEILPNGSLGQEIIIHNEKEKITLEKWN